MSKSKFLDLSQFERLEKIGKGQFGAVYKVKCKKTNEILKTLDADAITPNGEEFINKSMNTIQKRKEFIENLLNKQIDDSISSSIIEEKKSSISSVLQTIRKCLKSREDHDVIIKFVSSINLLLSRCKSNMTIYPQNCKIILQKY